MSVSKGRPKAWRGIGMKDKDQYGNEVLFVHFADNRPLPKWMDRGNKKNAVCLLDIVARQRNPNVKG